MGSSAGKPQRAIASRNGIRRCDRVPILVSRWADRCFFHGRKIEKADISGGPVQTLCDASSVFGGTWNSDGVIVFRFRRNRTTPSFVIRRHSHSTDGTRSITRRDGASPPNFSARWKTGIFCSRRHQYEAGKFRDLRWVTRFQGTQAAPDVPIQGHFLHHRDTFCSSAITISMAQHFDANRLELSGEPFPVVEGVGANIGNSGAAFTVSANGMLAYRTAESSIPSQLGWFERTGRQTDNIGEPERYLSPALSPGSSAPGSVRDRGEPPGTSGLRT